MRAGAQVNARRKVEARPCYFHADGRHRWPVCACGAANVCPADGEQCVAAAICHATGGCVLLAEASRGLPAGGGDGDGDDEAAHAVAVRDRMALDRATISLAGPREFAVPGWQMMGLMSHVGIVRRIARRGWVMGEWW